MKIVLGGSKFLRNLSSEIAREFPSSKGFSVSNLKNMARFYREYSEVEIGQTPSVQIPWNHNLEILRVDLKNKDFGILIKLSRMVGL